MKTYSLSLCNQEQKQSTNYLKRLKTDKYQVFAQSWCLWTILHCLWECKRNTQFSTFYTVKNIFSIKPSILISKYYSSRKMKTYVYVKIYTRMILTTLQIAQHLHHLLAAQILVSLYNECYLETKGTKPLRHKAAWIKLKGPLLSEKVDQESTI